MLEETATVEAAAPEGVVEESTLLTDGPERKPDEGEGDRKPDQGEGEKGAPATDEADDQDEGDDADGDAEAAEYTDFEVPKGVTLDADMLSEFVADAKERGLTQEQAQKDIDRAVALLTKQQDALTQSILDTRKAWEDATRADNDIGGDALEENLGFAKTALETFGTPALVEVLNQTGFGNHPEFIRLLARVGDALGEDKFVAGKTATPQRSSAQILYPNNPTKE
jgi:hypothetical protein